MSDHPNLSNLFVIQPPEPPTPLMDMTSFEVVISVNLLPQIMKFLRDNDIYHSVNPNLWSFECEYFTPIPAEFKINIYKHTSSTFILEFQMLRLKVKLYEIYNALYNYLGDLGIVENFVRKRNSILLSLDDDTDDTIGPKCVESCRCMVDMCTSEYVDVSQEGFKSLTALSDEPKYLPIIAQFESDLEKMVGTHHVRDVSLAYIIHNMRKNNIDCMKKAESKLVNIYFSQTTNISHYICGKLLH